MSHETADGSMIVEHVHLPDRPKPGRYDRQGKADKKGSVFVEAVGPTTHVWAAFESPLEPRQSAAMIFENVDGSGILDTIVSEWIEGGEGRLGKNFNQPHVGLPVVLLVARQRAVGRVKVVGLNASRARIRAAAALLYIPGSGG